MIAKMEGMKEAGAVLKALRAEVSHEVVEAALEAGARVIEAAAKSGAPVETGELRDNIKAKPGKRKDGFVSWVVDSGGAAKEYIGAFLEWGFHIGRRKLKNRRFVEGTHWFEKSSKGASEEAVETFNQSLIDGTNKALHSAGATGSVV